MLDANSLSIALLGLLAVILGAVLVEIFSLKEQLRQISIEGEKFRGEAKLHEERFGFELEKRDEKLRQLEVKINYWSAWEFAEACNLVGGTYHFDTKSCVSEKGREVRYFAPFTN